LRESDSKEKKKTDGYKETGTGLNTVEMLKMLGTLGTLGEHWRRRELLKRSIGNLNGEQSTRY
jgi:hypothetical protein